VAITSVVLGWLGREALTPGIGPTALPFIFFFPAVAIAAWFGGLGPRMLAVALSALAAHWFFTIRVAKDGRHIPVSVSISPLKNADGEIIGASKIIHDISDIVAAREALVREKELLATTLASIGDAVIITDANGRITFLNAEAERLTKWRHVEAIALRLQSVGQIAEPGSLVHVTLNDYGL
jgi:PAS domain-containing protein